MRVRNFLRFVAGHPTARAHQLHPEVFLVVLEEEIFAQHQQIVAQVLLDDRAVVDAAAVILDNVNPDVEVACRHFMLWSEECDLHSLLDGDFGRFTLADKQKLAEYSRDYESVFGIELNEGEWIDDVVVRRRYSLPFVLLVVHVDVRLLAVVRAAVVQQRYRPILIVIGTVGEL